MKVEKFFYLRFYSVETHIGVLSIFFDLILEYFDPATLLVLIWGKIFLSFLINKTNHRFHRYDQSSFRRWYINHQKFSQFASNRHSRPLAFLIRPRPWISNSPDPIYAKLTFAVALLVLPRQTYGPLSIADHENYQFLFASVHMPWWESGGIVYFARPLY